MKTVISWWNELTPFEQEKLIADPFYYSMAENGFSYAQLKKSGWLNHSYSLTELQEVMKKTVTQFEQNNIFILLSTGSYAPAHEGHITQLKQAKKWVTENHPSYKSILCLSPSHDKYVLTKSENIKPWNINARVKRLYSLIKEEKQKNQEAIVLDLWEAAICEYPVNFTDVIMKFKSDLEELNINFKIGYVFGSDNQDFSLAFSNLSNEMKKQFFAICIKRENYANQINNIKEVKSENVIYLENDIKTFNMSSRYLRETQDDNCELSKHLRNSSFYTEAVDNSFYAVRKDSEIALKDWITEYPENESIIYKAYDEFHQTLKNIIKKYTKINTISIDLTEQIKIVQELQNQEKIINLDIGTNWLSNYRIDYTRVFIPSSDQISTNLMQIRPEQQEKQYIPPGEYAFMDDDIASGKTFKNISQIFQDQNIKFTKTYNLTELYCHKFGIEYNLYDIVDTKDFLVGTYSGGLLCYCHQKNVRLPYFSKFVNLYTRASILPSDWNSFQNEISEANMVFFEKGKITNKFLEIMKD